MKKILSLFLAVSMIFCFGVSAAATEETKTFPMTISTGYATFEGNIGVNTNIAPDNTANDSIIVKENDDCPKLSSVKILIEGTKYSATNIVTSNYAFVNYKDAACTTLGYGEGKYWRLFLANGTATLSELLITSYTKIYSIRIVATTKIETNSEKIYNEWGTTTKKIADVPTFTVVKDFDNAFNVNGIIKNLLAEFKGFDYISKEVKYDFPFIPATDENGDGIVTREEVKVLSYSELGQGKGIEGFEGLLSQIATFFNKKDNGTITFEITTAPATTSAVWTNGGVPSSQIGIIATTETFNHNIVGLFFNYEKTGSLVSLSKIENNKIVFDISDVLDEIDGNTIATFSSIYYGLVGGISYTNVGAKGVKIDKVILSYIEDEDEVDTTDDTVEDTDIEDNEEADVDIDEEDIDDDEDAEIVDDEEEDVVADAEVEEDEDTNPATGTALVILPMIVAGAVVVTSRKRK